MANVVASSANPLAGRTLEYYTPSGNMQAVSPVGANAGGVSFVSSANPLYGQLLGQEMAQVVTPPAVLASTASTAAKTQLQVAGEGAPLRVTFGEDYIGAQVGALWWAGGYLYMQCIWGLGPAGGVQTLTINDQIPPSTVSAVHYTGAPGQGIDPWLQAAGLAQTPPVTYADTMPGIAYSVVRFAPGSITSMPQVKAVFKGLLLTDPRAPTAPAAWSENPGLALYWLLTAPDGENKTVTGGADDVANWCDTVVTQNGLSEVRCRIGLTLNTRQLAEQWRATIATYAECFIVPDGDGYLLIPDSPADSEYTFDHNSATLAGSLLSLGTLTRAGMNAQPTVVTVFYTNRDIYPWATVAATPVKRPEVITGALPWRPQEIQMSGIYSVSQAIRLATTRLNKLWLCDLSGEIHGLDDSMQIRPGTVVTLNDPRGLVSKQVRVMSMSGINGQYVLPFTGHDNDAYDYTVVPGGARPDTPLPLPNNPPNVTGLMATEIIYQQPDGSWASRIQATCDASDFLFLAAYRFEAWTGGVMIDFKSSSTPYYVSPTVQQGVNYTIYAYIESVVGAISKVAAQTNLTALGNQLLPSNVSSFTGFSIGGDVRLDIGAAIAIGMRTYEIRYAPASSDPNVWQTCSFLQSIPATSGVPGYLENSKLPAGIWELLCCACDALGNYSATPARLVLTVGNSTSSYLVGNISLVSPTVTNMTEYQLGRTDAKQRWVTDDGVPFGTAFTSVVGTYSNLVQDTAASTWLSETHDFGVVLSGTWVADTNSNENPLFGGTSTEYLELSLDGTTWTQYTPPSAQASARYARYRAEAAIGSGFNIYLPTVDIRVNAIPQQEHGNNVMSSASGPTTVSLANGYADVESIVITVLGTTSLTYSINNITLGARGSCSFDVYIFDGTNTQVANAFNWNFAGV